MFNRSKTVEAAPKVHNYYYVHTITNYVQIITNYVLLTQVRR